MAETAETAQNTEAAEAAESAETAEAAESKETADTAESAEAAESKETADTAESAETADNSALVTAPDYLMEGFDGDSANHDWETNLFFQRMQEDTGIAFEFRQHTDEAEWNTRKQEIAEGTDLPDVLFKAQLTDEETLQMAEAGILIDLKPYLEEYAPDLWAILQANPEYLAAVTMSDGTIRTLPSINELQTNNLIWINQTWLNNLHLEVPTTAEELTEVLRAFRDGDANRNGNSGDEVPLSALGMWDLRFLGHAFGIIDNDYYLSVTDGKVSSSLTSENNRAFLTWLHELWQENLLSHTCFTTVDSLRQITDTSATITYGMFLANNPLSVVPNTALDQYATIAPLTYEGGQVYRDLLGSLTRGTFALTKNCAEPERMIAWVNRLFTEEGSILIQAGREGVEYLWLEDGTWEWEADLSTVANEILPAATLSDGGVAPGIITRNFQQKYSDASTRTLIENMMRVREFAKTPFPLVWLSAEDAETAARLQAEIAPYAEKKMAEFVTGDTPLTDENWAEFTAEVEKLGLSEMIALWQKYVTE